jgi:hypothetical protein
MNRDPLPVEMLISTDERRPVTVEEHAAFRQSITPPPPVDPIDDLLDELRTIKSHDSQN